MRILAAAFRSAASCASNVPRAAAVTRPSRSAVIVATRPIPSRTTSCDSLLRCAGGNFERTTVASIDEPKVLTNVTNAVAMGVKRPSRTAAKSADAF